MKLGTSNYHIVINKTTKMRWTNILDDWKGFTSDSPEGIDLTILYKEAKLLTNEEILSKVKFLRTKYLSSTQSKESIELAITTLDNLKNFFVEFDYTPNFRFVNTLANLSYNLNKSKDYVKNYFALTDNMYSTSISEKIQSIEFNNIITSMSKLNPTKHINTRLKIYYGAAGSGKTTAAMKEVTYTTCCNSSIMPDDLLEGFDFVDGKPTYINSPFLRAMIEGKSILLDEINLLPFDTLRFLQTVLDGKDSFEYKKQTIHIHPNFSVIGTMNLQINGQVFSLPEPLIDRASELLEFKLSTNQLIDAIW